MTCGTSELEQVAERVIAYRDSKGFSPVDWDVLPVKLACIFCEIEELTDALDHCSEARVLKRAASIEVNRETADVAMYALSILKDMYDGAWTMRSVYHGGPRSMSTPVELTKALRRETRGAFEHWRRGNRKDVMIHLELLLAALIDLRTRCLGIVTTLAADIDEKIAHAAGRPALHGGKDPRS